MQQEVENKMINSDKIKGRMRELGLIQKDVARELGVAVPTATQKINGVRPLYLDEVGKLADLLQINPTEYEDYFFAR
jgi:transcriptional regulator with XRE-family HTH domain